MKNLLPKLFITLFIFCEANNAAFSQSLAIQAYTPGLTAPIDIKNCGDDRLFVAERGGRIRVINANGTLRTGPFLDITAKISPLNGEQGLLGFAFSPNYKTDGKFYVYYTAPGDDSVISVVEEYKVNPADSNLADAASALTILTQQQPDFTNHKGGNMMFDKDGYLYISLGDGGSAGDPRENGQNKNTFLGKILRIDVSNSSIAQPYIIPASNPLFTDPSPGVKKEIWAYGMRNPWRGSIDRLTGDIWVPDVGQDNIEEINMQPVNAPHNPNFGWDIIEGTACFEPPAGCDATGLRLPLYEYTHATGISITGGYVARSAQSKALFGTYIYSDYGGRWLDGLRLNNGAPVLPVTRLLNGSQVQGAPISFGEDWYGDLYILFNNNNTVYKISDTSALLRPKAYFTPVMQSPAGYLFQGLRGAGFTYQWVRDGEAIPGATDPDHVPQEAGTYTLIVTNSAAVSDTSDPFLFNPLPLELKNFTAQRIDNEPVQLQWTTNADNDVAGYVIQKRTGEENVFSDVAFVPARSGATDVRYTYIDSSANATLRIFYRLIIQKKDGSRTFSDIKSVNGRAINTQFLLYPNPAGNKVSIQLSAFTQPVNIIFHDYLGNKVKQQRLTQQVTMLSLHGLRGVYTVLLIDGKKQLIGRSRLVVQ